VRVPNQAARPWVADRADAVQVGHFAFESSGRKRQIRERPHRRIACWHDVFEFDTAVRPSGEEQVHHPHPATVVVRRCQRQPEAGGQQIFGLIDKAIA
jgi:hypothetical protein